MKIGITGGRGFVGRPLTKIIQNFGHDLVHIDSHSELQKIEVLIHCAGEYRDESKMIASNVQWTEQLLKNTKSVNHVIFLSSVAVYGKPLQPLDESSVLKPANLYGHTKSAAESLIQKWSNETGKQFTILRPTNIFGRDMPAPYLRSFVRTVEKGWFFFVGSDKFAMNYVFVDDVVRAVAQSLDSKKSSIYNLSQTTTVATWVDWIQEALGTNHQFWTLPEKLVRAGARFESVMPKWPLTNQRIDALTTPGSYRTDHIIKDLNFTFSGLEQNLKDFVRDDRPTLDTDSTASM
jgi:nucleoside-diphosphate-sugar epimerase